MFTDLVDHLFQLDQLLAHILERFSLKGFDIIHTRLDSGFDVSNTRFVHGLLALDFLYLGFDFLIANPVYFFDIDTGNLFIQPQTDFINGHVQFKDLLFLEGCINLLGTHRTVIVGGQEVQHLFMIGNLRLQGSAFGVKPR
ncbi:hypothetical protein D3C72_1563220 [compost metagenome]